MVRHCIKIWAINNVSSSKSTIYRYYPKEALKNEHKRIYVVRNSPTDANCLFQWERKINQHIQNLLNLNAPTFWLIIKIPSLASLRMEGALGVAFQMMDPCIKDNKATKRLSISLVSHLLAGQDGSRFRETLQSQYQSLILQNTLQWTLFLI